MNRPERLWQWRIALSLGMLRSKFMETTTAEEYTELRAMARIEKVGLERFDLHAMAVAQSMGAEFEDNPFAYEDQEPVIQTTEQMMSAMAGTN